MLSLLLAGLFFALLVASFMLLSTESVDPEYAQALRDWMRESAQEHADWLDLVAEAAYYDGEVPTIGEGKARVNVVTTNGHEWMFAGRTVQGALSRARAAIGHLGRIERAGRYYTLVTREEVEARLQDAVAQYSVNKTPLNRIALVGAIQDLARVLYTRKDAQAEFVTSWLLWA